MENSLAAREKAVASWVPGAVVGRFTLLAKLATGGMAEIWLARQGGLRGFEKVVVIKRILDAFSSDPSFVEMFLDEARIAAQLNHPNIVQVHDLGECAGAYYIAMEYLPSEHVAAVARTALKQGTPLGFTFSVQIAVAALDGLAHAHARVGVNGKPLNVVHRDVSPQNIVLTYDGQVKLVDFGIAKAANRSVQTSGGQLKGKFAYMAPEQAVATARGIDGRADLFAIGVVLYELLSHKRLWPFEDQVEQLTALIGPAPVPELRERSPEVPEALAGLVMRALAKDPQARWSNATEFKSALEHWLRTQGGGPTNSELGALMHQLFSDRIARRTQLIEKANRGDLTPMGAGEVIKPPTDRSMPGATPIGAASGAGAMMGVLGTLLGLGVLGLGLVGYLVLNNSSTATVVEIPIPQPIEAPPPAVPAELVIQSQPAGATLRLDGQSAGVAPTTISPVEPGEHLLEASLDGHTSVKRVVKVAGPGERQRLVISLEPVVAGVAPKVAAAKGRLTLSTDPWTHVFEGDRQLGDTPLVEVPLTAGRHQLRLVNEERKLSVTIEVEVKAGQLTKKVLKL